MKKLFITLSAVLALAACSESNIAEIENPQQEENVSTPVTFNITVQEQGATKALKTDWADGDVIYIRFNGINDKYIFITYNGSTWDVTESTAFSASDFEGKTLTLGAVHFPIDVEASFSGNNLQFKKDGQDVASYCMYQSNADYTVDGINVTIKLSLQKPDNVVLFHVPGIQANASDYSLKVSAEETYVRAFLCRNIGNDGNVNVTAKSSSYPIIGVADADGGLFCATYMEGNGLGSSKDYTLTVKGPVQEYTISGSLTLNAGYQYSLPALNDAKWTTKFKPFTVAAGKQVYIAPGNLQATTTDLGTKWTWDFAEHQYDFIGDAAANTKINGVMTVSQNGTVDLFGWVGTSATTDSYGIDMENTDATNHYGTSKSDNLKQDWGTLAIGSYPAGTWRSLTLSEWEYLLDTRSASSANLPAGTNSSAARYTKGTICGVKGLILFPDNYTHPSITVTGTPVYNNASESKFNTFIVADESDWNKMEEAGAVFIPISGYREGTTIVNHEYEGIYWTSSVYSASYTSAYTLYFTHDSLGRLALNRHKGCLVRLVHEL